MNKYCAKCEIIKSIDQFSKNSKRKDKHAAYCKPCQYACQAVWYKHNKERHLKNVNKRSKAYRQEVLQWYKDLKKAPCTDCRKSYHSSLMEYDHVDTKRDKISEMVNGKCSKEVILSEIARCELVCAMCHKVRTWNRKHPDEQISWLD